MDMIVGATTFKLPHHLLRNGEVVDIFLPGSGPYAWASSNDAVVAVSVPAVSVFPNGAGATLTAVSPGVATVTCSYLGQPRINPGSVTVNVSSTDLTLVLNDPQ